MPEMQQRGGVRHVLLKKVDPHEFPHGIAVVNGALHALVRQAEPALQQIHPQHDFYLNGWTPAFPRRIVQPDNFHPILPWNDLLHDLLKFFPLRFLLSPPYPSILPYFPS